MVISAHGFGSSRAWLLHAVCHFPNFGSLSKSWVALSRLAYYSFEQDWVSNESHLTSLWSKNLCLARRDAKHLATRASLWSLKRVLAVCVLKHYWLLKAQQYAKGLLDLQNFGELDCFAYCLYRQIGERLDLWATKAPCASSLPSSRTFLERSRTSLQKVSLCVQNDFQKFTYHV